MGHPQISESADAIEALVRRAQRGEEGAFEELIRCTQNRLFRFLYFLSGDATLAGDLCQDTYLYTLEHLSKIREPKAFPHWLFLVGRNRFFDHRRNKKNRPPSEKAFSTPRLAASDRELAVQTLEIFSKLDPDWREVLLLIDLEGHSYLEASEIIGISESATRSRLHRAREAFHRLFFQR
jgi:RNA polymerase sigma-70 factor (ECF subfamily)